ncbi:hypothetical protein BC830DRAFT_430861 [Chytriomyces sp. MP71]|nr:hypothetical protein BC830DRAFT_430861 [Chytriomyces sp. MP71]
MKMPQLACMQTAVLRGRREDGQKSNQPFIDLNKRTGTTKFHPLALAHTILMLLILHHCLSSSYSQRVIDLQADIGMPGQASYVMFSFVSDTWPPRRFDFGARKTPIVSGPRVLMEFVVAYFEWLLNWMCRMRLICWFPTCSHLASTPEAVGEAIEREIMRVVLEFWKSAGMPGMTVSDDLAVAAAELARLSFALMETSSRSMSWGL